MGSLPIDGTPNWKIVIKSNPSGKKYGSDITKTWVIGPRIMIYACLMFLQNATSRIICFTCCCPTWNGARV
jgi:hypothetical protein